MFDPQISPFTNLLPGETPTPAEPPPAITTEVRQVHTLWGVDLPHLAIELLLRAALTSSEGHEPTGQEVGPHDD